MSTESEEPLGFAVLSDSLDTEGPWTIHGVALGVGDVTVGSSGLKKLWTAEALEGAAETLSGTPIVKDHINHSVDAVVGQVTEARFKDGVGVVYEGEIDDEDLALKIQRNRLEVSPRLLHGPPEDMEENEDGALVVDEIIEFVNLALVTHGAAPSNEVQFGESSDLSRAALAAELQAEFGFEAPDAGADDDEGEDLSDDTPEETDGSEEPSVDEENLQSVEVHTPEWSGTDPEADWSEPALEDFTDESWNDLSNDEKSSIGDNFIVSKTGFPAENFGDLALPVVDTEGNLVKNAVDNAAARVGQVSGLSGENLTQAESVIDSLQGEFDSEEENADSEDVADDEENSLLIAIQPLGTDRVSSVKPESLSQIDIIRHD